MNWSQLSPTEIVLISLAALGLLTMILVRRRRQQGGIPPPKAPLKVDSNRLIADEPRAFARELTSESQFPLKSGHYRLVFGVPRKLWAFTIQGTRMNLEAYRYELVERAFEEFGSEIKDESAIERAKPIIGYELEGEFENDGCYWPTATMMIVRPENDEYRKAATPSERESYDLTDFRLRLYEHDEIYDGKKLIFNWQARKTVHEMFVDQSYCVGRSDDAADAESRFAEHYLFAFAISNDSVPAVAFTNNWA